jgi:hypothetical protein
MDCPSKDVIEDDDMLDGWFILQNKKREKEKAEAEFDKNTNEKIKNSSEVFVMANNKNDKERIESMNSYHAMMVKKEREKLDGFNFKDKEEMDSAAKGYYLWMCFKEACRDCRKYSEHWKNFAKLFHATAAAF